MKIELQRFAYTHLGTLGWWTVNHNAGGLIYSCLSAENPDRGNVPNESCIPEGDYKLVRSHFHRGGYECFQVFLADGSEIPGRTLVKVHRGNSAADVQGCIVLGRDPTLHWGRWGVGPSGGSTGAFTAWMEVMDEVQECPLTIFFRKG